MVSTPGYLLADGLFALPGNWGEDRRRGHKMAATVKKDGIRKRRFAQISTKHALSTPYSLQW